MLYEQLSKLFQDRIASGMTIGVIYLFESVNINGKQGKLLLVIPRTLEFQLK